MKRHILILLVVLIAVVSEVCTAQTAIVMYADSSRRGVPFSKDPHVIRFNGKYLMYSSLPGKTGSNVWEIGIAESYDLIHWENAGIIKVQEPYEKSGICAPCALLKDGKVHLFYQTYGNGKNDAICHAISEDGLTNFKRNSTNPIFKPTGDWNCGRAIDAEVAFFKGEYFLFFATRDPQYKIQLQGVATAPKSTDFSRDDWHFNAEMGPILQPELTWEGECVEGASVISRNGQLYMFYAGAYNNSPQQVGVAVGKDGFHWKRLSDQPFLANGQAGDWNSSESGHPNIFDDGKRTFLFYQGNNDMGKTWWISYVEVFWNKQGPRLK